MTELIGTAVQQIPIRRLRHSCAMSYFLSAEEGLPPTEKPAAEHCGL